MLKAVIKLKFILQKLISDRAEESVFIWEISHYKRTHNIVKDLGKLASFRTYAKRFDEYG